MYIENMCNVENLLDADVTPYFKHMDKLCLPPTIISYKLSAYKRFLQLT